MTLYTLTEFDSLQNGDSAVIRATVWHRSGALQLLVDAGADLNLQNEVSCKVTMDCCTMYHPWLSKLGGSDSSDDLSKEWEDGADRYSTGWK